MNTSNFPSILGPSAPTPPESPLNFADLPLDLTASSSPPSSISFSPLPSPSSRHQRRSVSVNREDEQYRLRRDKNNIAAKKSRDARRAREAETAERAKKLEEVVVKLQAENEMLRREVERLRRHPMQ